MKKPPSHLREDNTDDLDYRIPYNDIISTQPFRITDTADTRQSTGAEEFDINVGGGFLKGSVIVFEGDPRDITEQFFLQAAALKRPTQFYTPVRPVNLIENHIKSLHIAKYEDEYEVTDTEKIAEKATENLRISTLDTEESIEDVITTFADKMKNDDKEPYTSYIYNPTFDLGKKKTLQDKLSRLTKETRKNNTNTYIFLNREHSKAASEVIQMLADYYFSVDVNNQGDEIRYVFKPLRNNVDPEQNQLEPISVSAKNFIGT